MAVPIWGARRGIESTINNARRALDLVDEFGSLSDYVWRYAPDRASRPRRLTGEVLMTMSTSPESVAMSKDLTERDWAYVGPTTVYDFMQAMGLVDDHLDGCFARERAGQA